MQNDTKTKKHHHIVNIQEKKEEIINFNHDYQEIKCRQDQEKKQEI